MKIIITIVVIVWISIISSGVYINIQKRRIKQEKEFDSIIVELQTVFDKTKDVSFKSGYILGANFAFTYKGHDSNYEKSFHKQFKYDSTIFNSPH